MAGRLINEMPDERDATLPLLCRALIRLGGWIAPARARNEWRARWESRIWNWAVLFERGELRPAAPDELLKECLRGVAEAFWLRFSREQVRHVFRSAGFVLVSGLAALAVIAVLSRGFVGTRSLFQPLPLSDPGSLVSIKYTGVLLQPNGVPPDYVPLWNRRSNLLSGVAGFVYNRAAQRAAVTADFFPLLGVRPGAGRLFRPGDEHVAVLTAGAWQSMFASSPEAIGRTYELNGQPYAIIGVLPDSFWAISPGIDLFTPLSLEPEPEPGLPALIGAVGRLKPGVEPDAVRSELFDLTKAAKKLAVRPPQVVGFTGVPGRPFGYALFILFALLVGGFMVVGAISLLRGQGWRYWSFLIGKTVILTAFPSLLWLEVGAGIRSALPEGPVRGTVSAAIAVVFLVACACAVWWSFHDQRRRCPVCLQRLTMPVTMGSWSSVLEPRTTEMLCDSGHGSLSVLDTDETAPGLWTRMDSSWRDLFKRKR